MSDFDTMVDDQAKPTATPSFDDMKADETPQSFDDMQDDNQSHPSTALAATEGAMRGLTLGLSDVAFKGMRHLAEKVTDDPAMQDFIAPKIEDVADRSNTTAAKVGEGAGVVGGFLTGTGVPGMLEKGSAALLPEATSALGKIGSAALGSAIQSMGIQAGDEMSKAMLGQGDPETPVSSALVHIGGAGLIGGLTGGVFNGLGQATNKGLAALENAKLGDKATNLLSGMGIAAKAHALDIPEADVPAFAEKYFSDFGAGDLFNYKHYKDGVKLYYSGMQSAVNKAADLATDAVLGMVGAHAAGPVGGAIAVGLSEKYIAPAVEKILQKPLIGANKLVLPTVMYALSKGQTSGLFNALNYAAQASKGANAINKGVEAILKGTGQQVFNDLVSERDKDKIKDYIDNGGVGKELHDSLQANPSEETPQFAKGGKVMPTDDNGSVGNLYPEQNMLLNAAKGRMSNYLNAMKPNSNAPKLPFDRKPDNKVQDKAYDNAVTIAAAPLSVLKHVNDGTLQAEHMRHMNNMYPELTQHLQKKLTKRMMEAQIDDKKPSFKTRQAMAIFLGSPLAQYQTPQGIQAAQQSFQGVQTPQQGQQQAKTKKGTSNLGKSNKSYQTASESAEADRSGRKA